LRKPGRQEGGDCKAERGFAPERTRAVREDASLKRQRRKRPLSTAQGRHVLNRLNDLLITAAPAKVSCQVISNLFIGWLRAFIQQGFSRQDESGSAITALQSAELHERFLDRIELTIPAQSFDGQDLATVCINRQHRAGAYRFTVKQQRASATHLNIAAELGAGQSELFANHIEERRARLDFSVMLRAVDPN
jgi:hypothetical protein